MLSIDIGSKKVCILEGRFHRGIVDVSSFTEIEYKEEIVTNGKIVNRPALKFLINEIIKTKRIKSKDAVISINNTEIIARDFIFPSVKPVQLRQLVNMEMQRIVGEETPFVIDYVINHISEEKMLSITAYAVEQEIVESYYTLLKELKLKPLAFDIHVNALSKLFSGRKINGRNNSNTNFIVADIGFSQITFNGFVNDTPKFSRTEESPLQNFAGEIASILRTSLTEEEAEKLDFSPGAEHELPAVTDTCKYFSYRLSEEIKRYLMYFMTTAGIETIERIYICSGFSSAKGLDLVLTELLNIPVEVVREVERVTTPKDIHLYKICNAVGALIRL